MTDSRDSFPRLQARTQRFRLGAPRSERVVGDGSRALFLRSSGPEDPRLALWLSDLRETDADVERVVADPRALDAHIDAGAGPDIDGGSSGPEGQKADERSSPDQARDAEGANGLDDLTDAEESKAAETLSDAERALRERTRERASGIVGFDVDPEGRTAAFTLDGALWTVDLHPDAPTPAFTPRRLDVPGPVVDPRVSPDGRLVAWSTVDAVVVATTDGSTWRRVAGEDGGDPDERDAAAGAGSAGDVEVTGAASAVESAESASAAEPAAQTPAPGSNAGPVTWGVADFIAGEEQHRYHGLWWSPDASRLLVQRTDESPVAVWHLCDPVDPAAEPRAWRYPRALTENARVTLHLVDLAAAGGAGPSAITEIPWDHAAFEYLTAVTWDAPEALVLVQSRDQRRTRLLGVSVDGAVRTLQEVTDRCWVDLVPGTPRHDAAGRVITVVADPDTDTYRVALDGRPVGSAGLQIDAVIGDDHDGVLAIASADPTRPAPVRVRFDGGVDHLAPEDAVAGLAAAADGSVLTVRTLANARATATHRWRAPDGATREHVLRDRSATPGPLNVRVTEIAGLPAAIVLPRPGTAAARAASLPVLVRPYGGPGARRVIRSAAAYAEDQWWADQGYLVLVADGRGAPGRGPAWDRRIHLDFAATLPDQVAAVHALPGALARLAGPGRIPAADLDRVAIMGWSFGGYLAALAVLRAPETFHAAIAGAPPADWTLYDTHYTERYLGLDAAAYRTSSLIDDAPRLTRPLLLVHGFADDNVTIAHTLRLSQALLAAGRPHEVLPLSGGITHMAADETVAEHLLLLQLDFLRRSLGTTAAPRTAAAARTTPGTEGSPSTHVADSASRPTASCTEEDAR